MARVAIGELRPDGGCTFRLRVADDDVEIESCDGARRDPDDSTRTIITVPVDRVPEVRAMLAQNGYVVETREADAPSDEEEEEDDRELAEEEEDADDGLIQAMDYTSSRMSFCLTGGAGVGKSYSTWALIQQAVLGAGRSVAVCATTGMAADVLAQAIPDPVREAFAESDRPAPAVSTFHECFGLLPSLQRKIGLETLESIAKTWAMRVRKDDALRERWNADVHVIDEISKFDADMFDLYVHMLNTLKIRDRVQTIVVGDFAQIAPLVVDPRTRQLDMKKHPKMAFEGRWWSTRIGDRVVELVRNHRVTDDPAFEQMMKRLRLGSVTPEDVAVLAARHPDADGVEVTQDHVWLVPTRKMAAARNKQRVEELEDRRRYPPGVVEAKRIAPGKKFGERITDRWQDHPEARRMIERIVDERGGGKEGPELAPGAMVMLNRNVDIEAGLVNGARGVVRECTDAAVEVDFETAGVHSVQFHKVHDTFESRRGEAGFTVQVAVMPLELAFAVTIDKAQGATLDKACAVLVTSVTSARDKSMTLRPAVFNAGQVYVALSRVRRLADLAVIGINECRQFIHPLPSVKEFYETVKERRAMQAARVEPADIRARAGRGSYFVDIFREKTEWDRPPFAIILLRHREMIDRDLRNRAAKAKAAERAAAAQAQRERSRRRDGTPMHTPASASSAAARPLPTPSTGGSSFEPDLTRAM